MRPTGDSAAPRGAAPASLARRLLALLYEALLLLALLLAGSVPFVMVVQQADREGLFLHDRVAGTKIVRTED